MNLREKIKYIFYLLFPSIGITIILCNIYLFNGYIGCLFLCGFIGLIIILIPQICYCLDKIFN